MLLFLVLHYERKKVFYLETSVTLSETKGKLRRLECRLQSPIGRTSILILCLD